MTTNLPIHPDDVTFYLEVSDAMARVAADYALPLKSVIAFPMPPAGMSDRFGDCRPATGEVRMVFRCAIDGKWCDAPLSPDEVWDTAAHELAHLRHSGHSQAHADFTDELLGSLRARTATAKGKVLDKLVKLQAARESEAAIGNEAAAEAFASAINRLLIEHELNPTDIDYARAADRDPIIELACDLTKYRADKKKTRVAWQESLARIVAEAHLCTFLVQLNSNRITFVGTKSHATVAEYAYGTLVAAVENLSWKAYNKRFYGLKNSGGDVRLARGFRASWLLAFVQRIEERFAEVRKAAIAAPPNGDGTTALLRLNGALAKAKGYINDKFANKRPVQGARMRGAYNEAGAKAGRAAADAVPLNRRGVNPAASQRALGA